MSLRTLFALYHNNNQESHFVSNRDRFRTAVNVWGDAIGAGVLDHIFRKTFAATPDAPDTSSDSTSTCTSNEAPVKEEGPPGYANGVIYDNQAFESAQELTRTRL